MLLGEDGKLVRFLRPDLLFASTTQSGCLYQTPHTLQQHTSYEELASVVGCGMVADRMFFGRSNGHVTHGHLSTFGTLHEMQSLSPISDVLTAFDVSSYGNLLQTSQRSLEVSDCQGSPLLSHSFPFLIRSANFFDEAASVGLIGNFFQILDLRSGDTTASAPVAFVTRSARVKNFQVALGTLGGQVVLFDLRNMDAPVDVAESHAGHAISAICATERGYVLSGSVDGSISMTDFARPELSAKRLISEDGGAVVSLTAAQGRCAYLTDLGSLYNSSIY
jgi:hypothetical protein